MSSKKGFDPYLLVSGFALFAMFFGAGNLIFPFQVGLTGGHNVILGVLGVLLTGVLLPVIGMLAASTDSHGLGRIADRIGRIPGLVLTLAIFLFTGMLYAVPRVVTVSWEMAAKPLTGISADNATASSGGLFAYSVFFFVITLLVLSRPDRIIDRIGQYLTPALLILLLVMIALAMFTMPSVETANPDPNYAYAPFATGLKTGYGTMDALASLVFGVVIITQLHARGYNEKRTVFRATALSAGVAGASLAVVYTGLAFTGTRVADQEFANPAAGLAYATNQIFGNFGQALFSLIVFLACITTAVGLFGASTQYYSDLFPKVPRWVLLAFQVVVSIAISNLGLENILAVILSIGLVTYPPAMCLILIALLDYFVKPYQFHWTYRLPAWIAAIIGVFEAASAFSMPILGSEPFAWQVSLQKALEYLPWGNIQMAWVVPALICFVIGLVWDIARPVDPAKLPPSLVPSGIPDRLSTRDED